MKKIIALVLVLVMVFGLVACASGEKKSDEKITIAASTMAYSIALLPSYLFDSLQELCEAEGWEFVMLAAEGDAELQGEQVSTLISKKPDYLVMLPGDPVMAIDWCQEAADADIPVIALHVDVDEAAHGTTCVAYCGNDNEAIAEAIYDYIVEKNGADAEMGIVEIGGVPVQSDYIIRTNTFNGLIEGTGYTQLGDIAWAFSSRADATTAMENFISSYGDQIDILVGFDDDLTLGGVNALQEQGMTDVQVYSITGQIEALQAIKDGKMTATVFTPTAAMAENAVNVIKALEAGETVDYFQYIETPIVDASNVDDFVGEF